MKKVKNCLRIVLFTIASVSVGAADDRVWTFVERLPASFDHSARGLSERGRALTLDQNELRNAFRELPAVIELPAPDGSFLRYRVEETFVMHPDLAAKFPDIRTYRGVGVDRPREVARLDLTPQGFHAQVFTPEGAYYIDPIAQNDPSAYVCYRRADVAARRFSCGVLKQKVAHAAKHAAGAKNLTTGNMLRTYRLAVAAQGEYTAEHGGTVAGGLAAIVTTVNRVNGVFERELSVGFQLVPNNNLIVYTNEGTDPYSANAASETVLDENQANLDAVIGSANYDVGHVFNTSDQGLAGLGAVCDNGRKAEGISGSSSPMGDSFDIALFAHELGHQFGAEHTFNGVADDCGGGNRNAATAYERGSGTTIMSYAGICGTDDVQPEPDDYFHATSLEEITTYLNGESCEAGSATGNNLPSVQGGADFTIPAATPFTLTAIGNDADGDPLTYCWEQFDLGPAQALNAADNGMSPLFRSFPPSSNRFRIFPRLTNILAPVSEDQETLPVLSRTMNFRVTVRDNRANGGGTDSDDVVVTVAGGAGPFRVTSPNAPTTISGTQNIMWDVANSDLAPVSAANVNILLSLDGGLTFSETLASNVANDGAQMVLLPSLSNDFARIRIEAVGNIFFDISDANFTIIPDPTAPVLVDADQPVFADTFAKGNNNGNGFLDPGETNVAFFLHLTNIGSVAATVVNGTLTSLTATATILTNTAAYPNIASGGIESNLTPFVISLATNHPCGAPVELQLRIDANEVSAIVPISLFAGQLQPEQTVSVITSTIIPDGSGFVDIPFNVMQTGFINDLDFKFDGAVCSADPNSSQVGLNHQWVGDLRVTLISPQGTSVVLIDKAGGGVFGSQGRNFCQTRLNDDGVFTSIQDIDANGLDQPHTGTWLPANPLAGFDGEQINGGWTLRVADTAPTFPGRVNSFSLIHSLAICDAPYVIPVYTIAASAGENGSIAPTGLVDVTEGEGTNFVVSADAHYHISNVRTNGSDIPPMLGPGVTNIDFAWSNVRAAGTIHANFSADLATNCVPVWWLVMHDLTNGGFDAAALADQDGDGASTWEEYKAGTNPTNDLSVLEVSVDENIVIRWTSVSNKLYNLWRSTNLTEAGSVILPNISGTPPMNTHTDTTPIVNNAFFTIEVLD